MTCAVCMEDVSLAEDAFYCNHAFCEGCIVMGLEAARSRGQRETCFLCRAPAFRDYDVFCLLASGIWVRVCDNKLSSSIPTMYPCTLASISMIRQHCPVACTVNSVDEFLAASTFFLWAARTRGESISPRQTRAMMRALVASPCTVQVSLRNRDEVTVKISDYFMAAVSAINTVTT